MKSKWVLSLLLVLIGGAIIGVLSASALAAGYTLDWWTVDGGGATFSTAGSYSLGGTIGQPEAGTSAGGNYTLDSGFWGAGDDNAAPVITEGASTGVTMSENSSPTPFSLTLHATDADVADTLTWSLSSPASHGAASAFGTGASKSIGYNPDLDYSGSDSFVVQVSDGKGSTDTITVNVTITPTSPAPFNVYLPLVLR
jgi:hypothetical protein